MKFAFGALSIRHVLGPFFLASAPTLLMVVVRVDVQEYRVLLSVPIPLIDSLPLQ
ncbi:hypothetical protein BJY04DRAFT_202555 [Aspergillus karnatakaensis]|uniref:uncharacterized protein n=1 Tax=Aspergillus karnatakaensis TaxID=1810916 RepID=UPI003CCDC0AC